VSNFIKSAVIHPVLFAIVPILSILSTNLNEVILDHTALSLLFIFIVICPLWYVINLFLKNTMKSGLIVTLGLIMFFSYAYFIRLTNQTGIDVGSLPFSHHTYALPIYFGLLLLGVIILIRTKKNLIDLTALTNIIGIVLIVMLLPNIVSYALEYEVSEVTSSLNYEIVDIPELKNRPNIYYIILDEYTRADILEEIYNYDNQDFLSTLNKKGFQIPSASYSNYATSSLALTSILNMDYINDKNFRPTFDAKNNLYNNNQFMRILKSLDYQIIAISLEYGYPEVADYHLCPPPLFLNQFHTTLMDTTLWQPFSMLFVSAGDPHRERILCKFSELSNLDSSADKPFFVYAHIMVPHPPYLFGPNGESVTPELLSIGAGSWRDKSGYVKQLQFTNKKVLETIDNILLESDTLPIIIIQGDHGTPTLLGGGGLNWKNINDDSITERMSIFTAYYFPHLESELIYDTITPVNTFRLVMKNYLNGDYELLEDRIYFSNYQNQLNFTDVTTMLFSKTLE